MTPAGRRLADILEMHFLGLTKVEQVHPSFLDALNEIVDRVGSVSQAARDIGVARSTVQRWRAGTIRSPKNASVEAVQDALSFERRTLDLSHVTADIPSIGITVDGRPRVIGRHNLALDVSYLRESARAYAGEDPEEMLEWFCAAVQDTFYRDVLYAMCGIAQGVISEYTSQDVVLKGLAA